ncbi:MAG: hypothetical protein MJ207_02675 [Bacilli bacterium]|nr:hypothetical protein [Bacilli bacterium]
MKILKAIGNVFVKIWRWIKNTAWVQPLLIVGLIFGVIFSIPAITSAIQNLIKNNNSARKFFETYQLKMEGDKDSEAQKLLDRYDISRKEYNEQKTPEQKKAVINKIPDKEKKFFLFFTSYATVNDDLKSGFEIAETYWKTTFGVKDDFRLYTIFTDEETTTATTKKPAFETFMDSKSWFFEEAAVNGEKTEYYKNGKITDDQLTKLSDCDPSNFQLPLLVLVDWKILLQDEPDETNIGITQLTFGLTGDDNWAKAKFLVDCWNGEGEFEPK